MSHGSEVPILTPTINLDYVEIHFEEENAEDKEFVQWLQPFSHGLPKEAEKFLGSRLKRKSHRGTTFSWYQNRKDRFCTIFQQRRLICLLHQRKWSNAEIWH